MAAINPVSSTSNAFSSAIITPLIGKIDGLFALKVVCFVAGTIYCLGNLYRAYQFSTHTSFGLDDNFKLVKCRALLLEADEATENVKPLLQQCEALLDSITDTSHSYEKENLLVELVGLYAKTEPKHNNAANHAYPIAQRLTFSGCLFRAAQMLSPLLGDTYLLPLYQQADSAREREKEAPNHFTLFTDFNWSLNLAKACHTLVGHCESARDGYLQRAQDFAATIENPLVKMIALCRAAEFSYEIQNMDNVDTLILSAKRVMANMPEKDVIKARLGLAETFLSVKNFPGMNEELFAVGLLFENYPERIHKNLYAFARLIKKIKKDDLVESGYEKIENLQVEFLIGKAVNHISSLNGKEQAKAYLKLASLYQAKLVDENFLEKYIDTIYQVINALPELSETEKTSKIDLLCSFIHYYKNHLGAKEALQKLYEQCPVEKTSSENYDKAGLGQRIIMLYNRIGLAADSEPFFNQHISGIVDQKNEKMFSKVNRLAHYGLPFSCFSKEQKKAALDNAADLFSELSRIEQSIVLPHIVEGYLQVDRQKSLAILTDLENQQAKSCGITAAVTTVATASIYFYPGVSPALILGVAIWRIW